jgi:hypothetical protein
VRKVSAPLLFLGGLLIIAAVAAATFGVVQVLGLDEDDVAADDPAISGEGGDPSEPPLAPNQVEVTGVATGITVEGATLGQIESPLVVTAPQGAGGGTLTDVEVDGELTDIAWDAGRPFDLQGAGGIEPQSLNLFAAPTAITVGFPDGVVNTFVPGSYGLETPVAIGRGGLGRPQQSVAFEATVESTLVFQGGATTSILPRELTLEASGRVLLEGTFRVRRSDGTVAEVAGVELPAGEYRLTATPRPDATGYDVEALLQGQVNVI